MRMMTSPENKFQTQLFQTSYASPLGEITLVAHEAALIGLWLDGQKHFARGMEKQPRILRENQILTQTKIWLDAYFRGENPNPRKIPLDPHGTDFQRRVWKILAEIPYGETMTYSEIAWRIAAQNPNTQIARKTLAQNSPKRATTFSARAVGGAVGRNPISIFIPCHRVVGAGGKLTGYAGGLDKKCALLKLENPNRARFC